jgi:hypothetical protein
MKELWIIFISKNGTKKKKHAPQGARTKQYVQVQSTGDGQGSRGIFGLEAGVRGAAKPVLKRHVAVGPSVIVCERGRERWQQEFWKTVVEALFSRHIESCSIYIKHLI